MLNFAVDHDWIEGNPAARLKKPTREHSRERVLTDEEIRRVWRLLSNPPTTADRPAPGRVSARTLRIDLSGHDFRRTAATRIAAVGVPREHIGRVLNHVESGARDTRVYDRHSYDGEKRAALDAWARSLSSILENSPKRVAAVVPIRRSL